jgi:hypothetical protein
VGQPHAGDDASATSLTDENDVTTQQQNKNMLTTHLPGSGCRGWAYASPAIVPGYSMLNA